MAGLLLVASAGWVGCATGSSFDYSKEPDPRAQEYVVGPSDQLRINVWRDEELSGEIAVQPDGNVTMALIGPVRAAGRTPSQIRQDIEKRLQQYLKPEQIKVTVGVITVNSYRFSVSGNVQKPGLFSWPNYVTVLEALAMAGGPNRFADPDHAVILRTYGAGNQRQIPINFDRLSTGERPEQNIVILPGDTIYVP
jgi:polysaccharide biosynthesis/export protein